MLEAANPISLPPLADYPVAISLFGPLQIQINGKPSAPFRLNKTRALLAYLLLERPQPLLRTAVAALLWPGYTPAAARASLRQSLDDLRNVLAPFPLLHTTRDQITLQADPAVVWCDVLAFNALQARWAAHEHAALANCQVCRPQLQKAVALVQGDFLPNLPEVDSAAFAAWVQAQRTRFVEQVATAQAVLTQFAPPPGNLRPSFTRLIGRTVEVAELTAQLHDPIYRCLSLVGPGGIGKTRLALALGEAQKANFPDGVWLVELTAPITSPAASNAVTAEQIQDQIATAIGAMLGITFHGTAHPHAQVAAYLRDKELLLILDNFELVSAGAELLLQLLAAAPRLRLVVNSRQRLPLQAQLVHIVQGLATPPAADDGAPDALANYASVQLFMERAQNAGFRLARDAATLTAIGALCRLVDGLPWAIELAVAMLDYYAPAALLQAIQADYRALTGNWLDLPPRLRSAEAVLHTMWSLLTPHEATQLACCALFRGGFTPAAIHAIAGVNAADLQALVHKSLVHPVGAARFTLHELVRQFAAEQLAQRGADQQTVAARHAAYYIALLQAQETALFNGSAAQTLIQTELDNGRAAWQWSVAQGEWALLTQGVHSLFTFYGLAGLYQEALQQLESALACVRQWHAATSADPAPLPLLARLLNYAADFYRRTGALATSAQQAEEALALGQQLADPALQAVAFHELARLAQVRGDFRTMQNLAEQGYAQAQLTTNPTLWAECLNAVGWALYSQQQPAAAIGYFQAALHALQAVVNYHLEGRIRANVGRMHLMIREYTLAQRHLQQALTLQQLLHDEEEILLTRLMLGELWTALGVYAAAQEEFAQAQALLQITANPYWVSWLQISYGYWQHLRGDPATARASLTLGRQTAQQSGNRLFERLAWLYLGYMESEQAAWAAAQACFAQCLALQVAAPWLADLADVHVGLARCHLAQAEKAPALTQVERALALLAQHGEGVANDLFSVYWFCFEVLQTVDAARAMDVLRTAYARLHACAAQVEDPALRRAFLNDVVVHRRLGAAAQAAGLR